MLARQFLNWAAAIFCLLVLCLSSPGVRAQAFGEGVLGWQSIGTKQYFGSGEAACIADWNFYGMNNGFSRFIGAFPETSNRVRCSWTTWGNLCHAETGGGINDCWTVVPASVVFRCMDGYVVTSVPGQCVPNYEKISANNICPAAVGNPVNIMTGDKLDYFADYVSGDGLFEIGRHYRSNSYGFLATSVVAPRGMVNGWQFNLLPELQPGLTGRASIVLPDGIAFNLARNNGTGEWESGNVAPYGDKYFPQDNRLTYVGPLPYNWTTVRTTQSTWTWRDTSNSVWTFETYLPVGGTVYDRGRPISRQDANGYSQTYSYRADNSLETIEDSFGRVATFEWHQFYTTALTGGSYPPPSPEAISKITFPDGTYAQYSYDPPPTTVAPSTSRIARLVKVERFDSDDVLFDSFTYHYEDTRFETLLTGITDHRGVRIGTYEYDARRRVISSQGADGTNDFTFAYGRVGSWDISRTVTNPLGKQAVYTFQNTERLYVTGYVLKSVDGVASTNCAPSNSQYTYAGAPSDFRRLTHTDEEGALTQYAYANSLSVKPNRVTYAAGTAASRPVKITWHADINAVTKLEEPGLTTEYEYNSSDQLVSVTEIDTTTHTLPYSTNGQERARTYAYTPEGLLASVDGPLPGTDDLVAYAYDASGYLETITDALGHVTQISGTDANGRATEITDANGVVTQMQYSAAGYLEEVTVDPTGANATTEFDYDVVGNVTAIRSPDGSEYGYVYDDAGRLSSIEDAKGASIHFERDDLGNVTETQIEGAGADVVSTQTSIYDELGRLLNIVGADDETWSHAYDKVSNLVSVEDPRGGVQSHAYDGLKQLITTVDEELDEVNLQRDGSGEVALYEDPRGIETSFVRNGWGEVIRETSPDIGTVTYERNELGLVTKRTDGRGVVTEYEYDDAGRLTDTSHPAAPAEDVAYSYDDIAAGNHGAGRLTGFVDEAGTTEIEYNSLGLIETENLSLSGITATTSYEYNGAGNVETITYPSGRVVEYQRDADGEIETVTTRSGPSAPAETLAENIAWHPFEGIASLDYGNGLSFERGLDLNYRLDELVVSDGVSDLINRVHRYGDDLNLTQIEDLVVPWQTQNYGYSAKNELADSAGPWGDEWYTRDEVGNSVGYVNDQGGGAVTTDVFDYPGTSNRLEEITRNGALAREYTYDAAGNTLTDTLWGEETSFTYNHAGRMASATRASTLRGEYTYNARGQLVIRSVTNSTVNGVTVYVYDQGGRVIAEFDGVSQDLKREYVWLGDMPLAIIDAGSPAETYFVHADHLNRPIKLTDEAQDVVSEVIWHPFGGWVTSGGFVDLDLRFPGQLYQGETGLHYNWNRQYDPSTGRYTQPDPLGLIDGPSRYAYAGNDPVQNVDPTGLVAGISRPLLPLDMPSSQLERLPPICVAMVVFPDRISKNNCIRYCSDTTLPTGDYGMRFARCVNQCMEGLPFRDWVR